MERKPIRLANPSSYALTDDLRTDEAYLWMERGALKMKFFNNPKIYNVSDVNIKDANGKVEAITPYDTLKIQGDFIKSTNVQRLDANTITLDIILDFGNEKLLELLPSANQHQDGLSRLSTGIDDDNMGIDNIGATPWMVKYIQLSTKQHINNVKNVLSPLPNVTDLPTSANIGDCINITGNETSYTYDTYLKSPRVIGTYKATGFDGSFPTKPITTIALCNVDIEFINYKNATNQLFVIINNKPFTLTIATEPTDIETLITRYDIPSFMRTHINWFTITAGNAEGITNGEYVYMKHWEPSLIPYVFIGNTSGWKTL